MLLRALLISVLAHLALLVARPDFDAAAPLPRAAIAPGLQARLTMAAPLPAPSGASLAPVADKPLPTARPQQLPRPRWQPDTPAKPASAARLPAAIEAAQQSTGPGRSGAPAQSPESPLVADRQTGEGLDADDLRQYRVDLAREARRFRRYPPESRQRGWEGEVRVSLEHLPGGAEPTVALARSSGHGPLDAQALEMVRQAADRAVVPGALAGRRFAIEVAIQFRLDD